MSDTRPSTPIDAIAEAWVTTLVDLVPDIAIYIGVPGRTGAFGDLSPAGHDLVAEARLSLEGHEAKLHLRDLNVIASPAQEIRETFDLMPTATEADWATI